MRIVLVTTGPVFVPSATFTTTGTFTVPVAVTGPEVCEDCGADFSELIGNDGKVRAVFCEYCEFGV